MNEIIKFAVVENLIDIDNYLEYVAEKFNATFLDMNIQSEKCFVDRSDISLLIINFTI